MQVVILCGGLGTRIRDLNEDLPKPMIPIGDHPIVWHIMNRYAEFGYKRFILCLGYKSWKIKEYFLNYRLRASDLVVREGFPSPPEILTPCGQDWEVILAETGPHTMTGGRLAAVAKYIDGDHFMLTYGDGVADIDIHRLTDFHRQHGRIGTVTVVRTPGRFGEVGVDGSLVTEFREKPATVAGFVSGGFFVFRREFLDRLPDDPGTILERGPLHELSADHQLSAYSHTGFWHCMDNSRDFQSLNQIWESGSAPWAMPPETRSRQAA